MKNALDLLREIKQKNPIPPVDAAAVETPLPDPLEIFFAEPLPKKPPLPDELQKYSFLHRMACAGRMPQDKARQVIEAIHDVADMLPNRNRRRLMIEARVEELDELGEWFREWDAPVVFADTDPFTPCSACGRGIGEKRQGCSGEHDD